MRLALAVMLAVAVGAPIRTQVVTPPIPCGLSLKDSINARPKIDGPPELIARVTVVPQPDSAIEITAVDLSNANVIIAGSSFQLEQGGQFALMLRNRSDQPVYEVGGTIDFRIGNHKRSFGVRWLRWREPAIPPGETVRFVVGSAAWSAGEPGGDVALFAVIEDITFKDCGYVVQSARLATAGVSPFP